MAGSSITLRWTRSGYEREQIENGARAEDVAVSLGFNRSTIFGWVAAYRNGGAEALRAKPVPGRPPKLTRAQMSMLFTMIAGSNPAQYQLDFALWTRDLVRQVIATRFGVELSVYSVGRDILSTAVARSKSSPPQPTANFACSSSRPTHQSSTPMNGSGRTSSMTVSVRLLSRLSMTCATKRIRAPAPPAPTRACSRVLQGPMRSSNLSRSDYLRSS
jgi:transposase